MTPLEELEHCQQVAREFFSPRQDRAREKLARTLMRERSDAVKKLVVYAEQLEAQIADLKIDVQMHEREHQRVERARELVKRWCGTGGKPRSTRDHAIRALVTEFEEALQ